MSRNVFRTAVRYLCEDSFRITVTCGNDVLESKIFTYEGAS